MQATHSWRVLQLTGSQGTDVTQHCSGQLQIKLTVIMLFHRLQGLYGMRLVTLAVQ